MAWAGFPKVSLGDLAGAVNKLQESVKSIEKNFDSALGLDQLQAGAAGRSQTRVCVCVCEMLLLQFPFLSA
jgi:hypothetical protein